MKRCRKLMALTFTAEAKLKPKSIPFSCTKRRRTLDNGLRKR